MTTEIVLAVMAIVNGVVLLLMAVDKLRQIVQQPEHAARALEDGNEINATYMALTKVRVNL